MSQTALHTAIFLGAALVLPCWVVACSGDDSTIAPDDAGVTADASTGDATVPTDADDTLDADEPTDARPHRDGGHRDGGGFDGGHRDGGRDGAVEDGGDEDAALDASEDAD